MLSSKLTSYLPIVFWTQIKTQILTKHKTMIYPQRFLYSLRGRRNLCALQLQLRIIH